MFNVRSDLRTLTTDDSRSPIPTSILRTRHLRTPKQPSPSPAASSSRLRTTRELAVWCTLIDGQLLAEARTSGQKSVQAVTSDAHVRMTILDRLVRATRQRLPVRGEKQFVRYSMPMNGDWRITLEKSKSLVPFHLQSEFAGRTLI